MKLYSGPLSLFTAKVRIALDEKGVDFQRIEVGWSPERRYEPHHPDVVALNPKRQVPVLVDGDLVVYDSTLILEYLEERFPEPPLYPKERAQRARCRDEILFPQVWALIDGVFYPQPAQEGAAQRVSEARSELARLAADLDKQLRGREYLAGAFSVADIATFLMLSTAATLGAPVPEACADLRAWLARVAERPPVRREIEVMTAFARALR
jgi:glutathione S-transferase